MSKAYNLETKWFVSNSKVKVWQMHPELYVKQFIEEVEVEEWEKACFKNWNMFEDYVTRVGMYGHKQGEEKFLAKYHFKDWYQKADLADKILMRDDEDYSQLDDDQKKKVVASVTRKNSLDELRVQRHWEDWRDEQDKIGITPWEKKMIVWMLTEAKRQPLADLGREYEVQVEMVAPFVGRNKQYNLQLRWKLDRLYIENAKWEQIKLRDEENQKRDYDRVRKLSDGEKKWLKIWLRDWKTTSKIGQFKWNIDWELEYWRQVAFYMITTMLALDIIHVRNDLQFNVVLDAISTIAPYPFEAHRLTKTRLWKIAEDKIVPYLEEMWEYHNTKKLPQRTWEELTVEQREELYRNPYYQTLDCTIQNSFIEFG